MNNKDLIIWWNSIDKDLKCILKHSIKLEGKPTISDLNKIANLEYIDACHFDLVDIYPLYRLTKLKKAIFTNTSIEDLSCFKNNQNLEYLDITFTLVKSLKPLWDLPNLKVIKCKRTPKLMYDEIKQFDNDHPNCKIIWDYEFDQHWLDFINLDQQVDVSQDSNDITNNQSIYEEYKKLEKIIKLSINKTLSK